jgi:hypothetical protein
MKINSFHNAKYLVLALGFIVFFGAGCVSQNEDQSDGIRLNERINALEAENNALKLQNDRQQKLEDCVSEARSIYAEKKKAADACQPPYGDGVRCYLRSKDTDKVDMNTTIDQCIQIYSK